MFRPFRCNLSIVILAGVMSWSAFGNVGRGADLQELIAAVKAVGPEGQGHDAAIAAMAELSRQPASKIPELLKGMNGANRLAVNWLRSAVEAAAQNGDLPLAAVKSFLEDQSNSAKARRLAYELIVAEKPDQKNAILKEMIDDPSLEIRRDAVALELTQVEKVEDETNRIAGYQTALEHAREIAQIQSIANALDELGEPVDLVDHFGMIMDWQLIGPFENKDQSKFDEVYPPEKEIDLTATYTGMDDMKVGWKEYVSDDEEGIVDLNKALGNHKGAIAYAYTEFVSDKPQDVSVRLGCINANKVWINGEKVISNDVYHAGMNLDQYIGSANLKKGKNTILIKVCQNEQTQSWAQKWQFQFRLSDDTGKAVVSAE